jgi:hypothetical protein
MAAAKKEEGKGHSGEPSNLTFRQRAEGQTEFDIIIYLEGLSYVPSSLLFEEE